MIQTQKVPPVLETNVNIDITIVADQEAFFADPNTPHTPTPPVDPGLAGTVRNFVYRV